VFSLQLLSLLVVVMRRLLPRQLLLRLSALLTLSLLQRLLLLLTLSLLAAILLLLAAIQLSLRLLLSNLRIFSKLRKQTIRNSNEAPDGFLFLFTPSRIPCEILYRVSFARVIPSVKLYGVSSGHMIPCKKR